MPARLSLLTIRATIRLDILVEPQHVPWVVLFLDFYEASVVWSVGRADKLVARIAQLVDVNSMRERPQDVARSLDPSHHFGLLCGGAPDTRHVYLIARLPQGKRPPTPTDPANSSPQRHYDHLAGCRRIVDCRGNRRNGGPAKLPQKKIRLE